MLYLSQVLGRPIRDLEGERVATVKDVIVRLGADDHPPVAGLVARYRRRDFFLSRWRMTELNQNGVRLNSDILDLRPFVRRENEVLLAKDVLDKQLIDVDGKRAEPPDEPAEERHLEEPGPRHVVDRAAHRNRDERRIREGLVIGDDQHRPFPRNVLDPAKLEPEIPAAEA